MHLYIHIPFCVRKCHYCAFYSVVPSPGAIDEYVHALITELKLRKTELLSPHSHPSHLSPLSNQTSNIEHRTSNSYVETIYFGGGTPSILTPEAFTRIANALRDEGLSDHVREWTVELNPASTTKEFLESLRKVGVNRISMGIQSFCDATLSRIGRLHDAKTAVHALEMAYETGFNDVGFDLIANLPGVTDKEWGQTLNTAISLSPKHISVYDLIIEPETEFGRNGKNIRAELNDDKCLDTLRETETQLSAAGFVRYEISNYALPGFECRHNLAVWHGEDYIGLGPAASSRFGLHRRTNAKDLGAYCSALSKGHLPPTSEDETLTPEDDVEERFVYGLRLKEGISPKRFALNHPTAESLAENWERRLNTLVGHGITERIDGTSWRLTSRGLEVCDAVISELLR